MSDFVSVIVPLYDEADTVHDLAREIRAVMESHQLPYVALSLAFPGVGILGYLTAGKLFAGWTIGENGPLFILGVLLTLVAAQLFTTGIVCEYLILVYYNSERCSSYSVAESTAARRAA